MLRECSSALRLGEEGGGSGGEGTAVCCASQDCLNAHTVSLFSSSSLHAATVAAALSSQASLSHSWIFAVASEFVFSLLPWLSPQLRSWVAGALVISLCPLPSSYEACSVVSFSFLGDSWEGCTWLRQRY